MLKLIYDILKNRHLRPYFIGQHRGECEEPIVIIKEGTQIPTLHSNRLGQKVIDIILMVPLRSYINLDPYSDKVKEALAEIDYLRKTGTETPTIVDDDKKAYTKSIEYVLIKKLEG